MRRQNNGYGSQTFFSAGHRKVVDHVSWHTDQSNVVYGITGVCETGNDLSFFLEVIPRLVGNMWKSVDAARNDADLQR